MHRLSLDTVSITYQVNPYKQSVFVLTISEVDPNGALQAWLNKAIDRGEVDGLMATLGITHPCETVLLCRKALIGAKV